MTVKAADEYAVRRDWRWTPLYS